MNFMRFVKLSLCVVCVLVFLTACSTKPNKEKDPLPTDQEPTGQVLISNPALSRSGALVVATPDISSTFNPLFAKSKVDKWLEELIFDGLFVFDASDNLEGALAESWTDSEDGLTYTVQLKENIAFHDGTSLTARDVIFTYDVIMNDAYRGPYAELASYIKTYKALNDFTIAFTFNDEKMENLKALVIPVLSESHYRFTNWSTFAEGFKAPIGTGAFKFDNYTENTRIVLLKNSKYWNTNANISGLIISQMDEAEALQAFEAGDIDLFEMETSKAHVNAIKSLGFGNVMTKNTDVVTFIGLDLSAPIFSEANVRKALLVGLNREQFIQDQWNGYATTIPFIATNPYEYTFENENLEMYTYDFEEANRLLDEIGWRDLDGDGYREKNGDQLAFTWYVFADVDWSYNLAIQASEQWEKLGFRVELIFGDYETMLLSLDASTDFEMWHLAWDMSHAINPQVLFGITNYANYNKTDAQANFDALNTAESVAERESLLRAWHILQNEDLPYLPIAKLKTLWAYNERLDNLSFDENLDWIDQINQIEIDVIQ